MANEQKAGVYTITNIINGRKYVGETSNFTNRKRNHLSNLRNNKHNNYQLQDDFNVFGESAFYFDFIQEVSGTKRDRLDAEFALESSLKNTYNIDGRGKPMKFNHLIQYHKGKPPHNKGKPSPLRGIKKSPEHCAAVSAGRLGKPYQSTVCPHCGKEGKINAMKRYHFDNCKSLRNQNTNGDTK